MGVRADVKPLPDTVTREARENLKRLGFELRYIPELNFGTLGDLKRIGEQGFLQELEGRYTKWRRYESLNDRECADYRVSRNLQEWYWKGVKKGAIEFSALPSQWLAIETVEKPRFGCKYASTPLAEKLGFRVDRFNVSWNDAHNAIERERSEEFYQK